MICADLYPKAKLLFVDFGQPEAEMERAACKNLFGSRGFEIATIFTRLAVAEDGVFIPARNLLLACVAAQYAPHIVMGGMLDDRSVDKNPTAFRTMSRALTDMSARYTVVSSPLFHLLKHEAVSMWLRRGGFVDRLLQTWSCYGPGPMRCLKCKACFRWAVALRVNGVSVSLPLDIVIERYLRRLHLYDPGRQWAILKALENSTHSRPVMCVDIDGMLTIEVGGRDYAKRTPNERAINAVNMMWQHNWIILHTSRPEEDRDVTVKWLDQHNVQRHALLMDKPPAARYFDDRAEKSLFFDAG
jgi:7-cyano-7-deazaguanine synthase in queuosine biosynthesis